MKRLRYFTVALLLVALITLTGCFMSDASKLQGKWTSGSAVGNETIGSNVLTIEFGESVGDGILGLFTYSYMTTIKWGSEQWIIDADEDAEDGLKYNTWIGIPLVGNALAVWHKTVEEGNPEAIDFGLLAQLDGNKLYINYLVINDQVLIEHEDEKFGPEYLKKI